jgi:hypothetical protein
VLRRAAVQTTPATSRPASTFCEDLPSIKASRECLPPSPFLPPHRLPFIADHLARHHRAPTPSHLTPPPRRRRQRIRRRCCTSVARVF